MADGFSLFTPLAQTAVKFQEFYRELRSAGFTEDEAIKLIAAMARS